VKAGLRMSSYSCVPVLQLVVVVVGPDLVACEATGGLLGYSETAVAFECGIADVVTLNP